MEKSIQNPSESVFSDSLTRSEFYGKVFLYFGLGILISSVFAILIGFIFNKVYPMYEFTENGTIIQNTASLNAYMILTIVSGIGLLVTSIFISFRTLRNKKSIFFPYLLYATFMGVLLSSCSYYIEVGPYTIGLALLITSICFLSMCALGYITHQKMHIWFRIFISLIIVGLLLCLTNFIIIPFAIYGGNYDAFYASMWIYWVSEVVILLAYLAITAFDMARIRKIAESGAGSDNLALYCALNLYSDFVILFLYILRFIGLASSKRD